jgi:hypothetical protein
MTALIFPKVERDGPYKTIPTNTQFEFGLANSRVAMFWLPPRSSYFGVRRLVIMGN